MQMARLRPVDNKQQQRVSPPLPQVGWNCSCSPIPPPHLIEYQRAELKNREIPNRNGQPLPNDIFPNEFPL